jgi:hypothetical protein
VLPAIRASAAIRMPEMTETAIERAGRAFEALGNAQRRATEEMWKRGGFCPAFLNLNTQWLMYAWETREAHRHGDLWAIWMLADRRKAMRKAIQSWRRLRDRGELPKEFLR